MNVLLVIPFSTNGTAGVGRIVRSLQQTLREYGHEAHLLMAATTKTIQPIPDLGWDHTYGLYLRGTYSTPSILRRLKAFVAFLAYFPVTIWVLSRFLRHKRIDVVHIFFPADPVFYFAILRRWARWRLVVALQGSELNNLNLRGRASRWLLDLIFARADVITACASTLATKLDCFSPVYHDKIVVIPNANPIPVPPDQAPTPPTPPTDFALSVGSLIPRKGHDILLRALHLAKEHGREIQLVIVGGGPERERLAERARELGVSGQVQLAGEVPHERMPLYYQQCRFFVLATRGEGMPLAVMEAMAFKKAVLVTSVDGIPEVVRDDETGLVVPPEDPAALASAMLRLDCDEALREHLAERGHRFVARHHTWSLYTERNLGLYEVALASRRDQPLGPHRNAYCIDTHADSQSQSPLSHPPSLNASEEL